MIKKIISFIKIFFTKRPTIESLEKSIQAQKLKRMQAEREHSARKENERIRTQKEVRDLYLKNKGYKRSSF